MKQRLIFTLCVFVSFYSISGAQQHITEKDIIYMTEEFPPHSYTENNQLKGISVEILEAMWKEMGSDMTTAKIQVMPWARAYNDVQTKKNTMLFSMGFSKEREPLFKWIGPYQVNYLKIFTKKSKNISIQSPEDLKKYTVGCVRQDIGEQVLVSMNLDDKKIDRSVDLGTLIKKLHSDRIDAAAIIEEPGLAEIKKQGLSENIFSYTYTLKELKSSYALNKETPDYLVTKFQNAFENVKANGTVDKIIAKYLNKNTH